ncbi:MAG: OB-fold nucleic acid binding domain-containing protein [Candidatus Thioglobus sp.]
MATRAEQGKFSDLLDLTRRVDRRTLSRRALEPLVRCGACDQLGEHRAATFNSIDRALKLAEQASRDSATGQANLFDNLLAATEKDIESDFKMQSATPWVMSQVLQGEKDTLGFYISGHPLQAHMTELEQWSPKSIASLAAEIGNKCLVAGIVQSVRHIITKRGKKMAVIVLEDKTGKLEVAIFPKLYPEVSDQLVADKVLLIKGEVGNDDFSGGVRLAADRLTSIESLRRRYAKSIRLSVSSKAEVDKLLIELPRITAPFKPGSCGLVVQYTSDGAQAEFKLGSDWTIEPDSSLLEQLESLCGDQTVTVDYS